MFVCVYVWHDKLLCISCLNTYVYIYEWMHRIILIECIALGYVIILLESIIDGNACMCCFHKKKKKQFENGIW